MSIEFWKFDVEFTSACYEYVLLPLVNKETVLANGLAEYSQKGNPKGDRESRWSQGDAM